MDKVGEIGNSGKEDGRAVARNEPESFGRRTSTETALHTYNESLLTPTNRIQTWALEEARRRLEVEGILKEPEDKS